MAACDGCGEEYSYEQLNEVGRLDLCDWCCTHKKVLVKQEQDRMARNAALGHTGSDMCSCEMCAARADYE